MFAVGNWWLNCCRERREGSEREQENLELSRNLHLEEEELIDVDTTWCVAAAIPHWEPHERNHFARKEIQIQLQKSSHAHSKPIYIEEKCLLRLRNLLERGAKRNVLGTFVCFGMKTSALMSHISLSLSLSLSFSLFLSLSYFKKHFFLSLKRKKKKKGNDTFERDSCFFFSWQSCKSVASEMKEKKRSEWAGLNL